MRRVREWAVAGAISLCLGVGCGCEPPGARDTARFDTMETVDLTINDLAYHAWVAKTDDARAAGLMFVTPEQMEPLPDGANRAMIFLFASDNSVHHGFYMKNVSISLDIAFIRSDWTIATIRTMAPFDHRSTYATEPYRYTLEVTGGLFKKQGVKVGDRVEIPESVLNNIQ